MATNIDMMLGEDSAEDSAALEEMRQADREPAKESPADTPAEDEDVSNVEDDTESAEDTSGSAGGPKTPQSVPYGVLREERDKRQQLERRLAQESARMQKMEETFQQLLQRAQEAVPQEEVPDFDLDPDAYTKHKLETIEKKLTAEENQRQEYARRQLQSQQAQQFVGMYANAAKEYAKEKPDMGAAYNYAITKLEDGLRMQGYVGQDLAKALEIAEERVVYNAFQAGENPAARIYSLAEHYGYKQKTATKDAADDKIGDITKKEAATKSLSKVSGGGDAPVSLRRLSELDGDDFDKAWEKARKTGDLG